VSKFSFVDVLPEALAEALHAHNDAHCTEEQIKLRMASGLLTWRLADGV
jgi:hypothetical protein